MQTNGIKKSAITEMSVEHGRLIFAEKKGGEKRGGENKKERKSRRGKAGEEKQERKSKRGKAGELHSRDAFLRRTTEIHKIPAEPVHRAQVLPTLPFHCSEKKHQEQLRSLVTLQTSFLGAILVLADPRRVMLQRGFSRGRKERGITRGLKVALECGFPSNL